MRSKWLNLTVLTVLVLGLFPATLSAAPGVDPPQLPAAEEEPAPNAPRPSPKDLALTAVDDIEVVGELTLYIVQLTDPSLARYAGGIPRLGPTSPIATGEPKLDVDAPASVAYLNYLEGRHAEARNAVETALARPVDAAFQYLNVLNAFAVELTPQEAAQVEVLPGVRAVYRDVERELTTDVGPALIGAPTFWEGEFGFGEDRGEGVIVGMLDSGVNPVHPS